jgi:glycosyltransferase involved in cell wall biosynthesis
MISVIIPTRNRADMLSIAIDSIRNQNLLPYHFEILVVDNGSTDHTAAIVQNLMRYFGNMNYIYEPEPGLHAGRHRGMLDARGDILIFADDDIEALPTWLSSVQEAFLDTDVAMVGGNNLPKFMDTPPQWLIDLWLCPGYKGGHAITALSILELPPGRYRLSPLYIWGCNFAIRKSVLLQAGGFHPDGMPKDMIRFRGDGESHVSQYVVNRRLKCMFHSGASVYHKVTPERMTYAYFRQRGFSQGISDSYTQLRTEAFPTTVHPPFHYRVARWGWRKLKTLVRLLKTNTATRKALNEFISGHREGFAYHQNAYRTDPDVHEWVHRERYF